MSFKLLLWVGTRTVSAIVVHVVNLGRNVVHSRDTFFHNVNAIGTPRSDYVTKFLRFDVRRLGVAAVGWGRFLNGAIY